MLQSKKQLYFYSPEGLSLVKYAGAGASALLRAAGRTLAQCDDGQAGFYATDIQGISDAVQRSRIIFYPVCRVWVRRQ
ncbi:hypothetical protein OO256_08495 [Pseudomonas sp. DCB_CB]|uniref:hypothetical protein n=1 Tax=Pseudomonas TaxID=286 RepID=UPI002249689D|nr:MULTISPECIES: hypothetical protein [unclassified Pseudomonas]MCX2690390.1 hypothetical protein [Pseudomonas sp. DCB_BZ]MCX2856142.1 hypothetical protein [Pseudomonas sp. DCB_CB]